MVQRRLLLPAERDVQLRTNFWVVPLLTAGCAAVAAIASVVLDHALQGRLTSVPLPLRLSADDAKTLLATLAGASITVVALVVSLTMVVLSLVATSFGPRIVRNFIRRLSTQLTIGAFIATFVYSLLTLVAVSSERGAVFVPLVSTWVAVVLVLASTAVLVAWVHDLAFSIQTGNALVEIASDLYRAIDARQAARRTLRPWDGDDQPILDAGMPVDAQLSGYVQHVDIAELVGVAQRSGSVIQVDVRPGEFVTVRQPLARLFGAAPASLDEVNSCFLLGAHRTLEQDLDFAIAQYVEIALRALSPGVNDPFTGVACVDWIGDALVRLAALPPEPASYAGDDGTLRVLVPPPSFARTLDAAFDQLRQGSGADPLIGMRLLRTIATIAPNMPASATSALTRQIDSIARALTQAGPDDADTGEIARAIHDARASFIQEERS